MATVPYEPLIEGFCAQRKLGGGRLAEWAQAVVWDQLQGMRCPDDLLSFFAELVDAVRPAATSAPPPPAPSAAGGAAPQQQAGGRSCGFDPGSALGKFLRRCSLAFQELPFEVGGPGCAVLEGWLTIMWQDFILIMLMIHVDDAHDLWNAICPVHHVQLTNAA